MKRPRPPYSSSQTEPEVKHYTEDGTVHVRGGYTRREKFPVFTLLLTVAFVVFILVSVWQG